MFKQRTQKKELMDDFSLANEDLRKNIAELVLYNRWLGGKHALLSALNIIYKEYQQDFIKRKINIVDLGCGGGDLLQAIAVWAKKKQINIDLLGIDANPFMIKFAQETFPNNKCQYEVADILTTDLKNNIDIYCLNSVCHHFSDQELMQLIKQLHNKARLAVIINDLRRNAFAYYAIKMLTKLFNFSHYAKHDAPLSVLRAFRKKELQEILKLAGVTSYQLRKSWVFRWQIIVLPKSI